MTRLFFMTGALALTLAACGGTQSTVSGGAAATASDTDIAVTIVAGKIVVADVTFSEPHHGAVRWTITSPGNYTFPRDGIVIDPGHFSCPQGPGGNKTFRCVKKGHKSGDQFKYIVNVNDGPNPLEPLDPWIFNR